MKYLLISDTHGDLRNLEKVLEIEQPIDGLLHMGDVQGDQENIRRMAGQEIPCAFVQGNCDFFYEKEEPDRNFSIGLHKIHMEHGHNLPSSLNTLLYKAESLGADIMLSGHTHKPLAICESGVWFVNPGSLTNPRQAGHQPSYCIMDIDPQGPVTFTVKYL